MSMDELSFRRLIQEYHYCYRIRDHYQGVSPFLIDKWQRKADSVSREIEKRRLERYRISFSRNRYWTLHYGDRYVSGYFAGIPACMRHIKITLDSLSDNP